MFTLETQLTCSASDKASHRYRSQELKSRLNQKLSGFQFASACEAYNRGDLFKVRYVSPQFKYLAFVYSLRFIFTLLFNYFLRFSFFTATSVSPDIPFIAWATAFQTSPNAPLPRISRKVIELNGISQQETFGEKYTFSVL